MSGENKRERSLDALLGSAIRAIEEIQAIFAMIDIANTRKRASLLATDLRELADLIERLPKAESDLTTIKKRLRSMMSTDPDKTPRGIKIQELEPTNEETRLFEPPSGHAFYRPETRLKIDPPKKE